MTEEQKQPRDTEALILHAAEKEFLEKGYAGAKTTSIAEAAGVTHAMFHYYFRTKDKLFEKIVADKMGKVADIMLNAIGNSELPLKERIIQGVENHFDFIAANPLLPRFIFNEVHINPGRVAVVKYKLLNTANDLLENLQKDIDMEASLGNCTTTDARMLLLDIVSLNIFPFVAAPIVNIFMKTAGMSYEEFLAQRKAENVKTILRKLNFK